MDEKEFKRQIKNEMKTDISDSQLDKVMQAIDQRQTRKPKGQKKILSVRNLSIIAASAVFMAMIALSVIFWPKGEITISFNYDMPFLILESFDEIRERTNVNFKLPTGFDEDYFVWQIKMYYPKVNQPCAVELIYRKPLTENHYSRIKVTIMLVDNIMFYEEPRYGRCETQGSVAGVNYMYSVAEKDAPVTCMAKFKVAGRKYFYDAYATEESTLDSFILSLI